MEKALADHDCNLENLLKRVRLMDSLLHLSLSSVERQYAQIEKECLAIVLACSRFNQCLHGRELATVETGHKPLMPIFQKSIHSTPKRLQRMLLHL